MSDMKCPICGGRLVYWGATGALLKCAQCKFGYGNEELWQAMINTKKKLDIAVDALKDMSEAPWIEAYSFIEEAKNAIDQINKIKGVSDENI